MSLRSSLARFVIRVSRVAWFCVPSFLVFMAVVLITSVLFHGVPLYWVAVGLALITLADRIMGGRL